MNRVAFLLFAAILLGLSACTPEGELGDTAPEPIPPFHFNITALPAAYQPWFAAAAEQWNTATGKTLIVIDPEGEHIAVLADLPHGRLGDARCDGLLCRVRLTTDTVWSQCGGNLSNLSTSLTGIATHELGHVLNAEFPENPNDPIHSLVSGDIMKTGVTHCNGPTARDVAAIAW